MILDELVLAGMSLMGGGATPERPATVYAAAAEELSALGVVGAHADPEPLTVRSTTGHRFGRLRYQKVTFDHDPRLPAALESAELGGPATAGAHLFRHADGTRPWVVWVHGAGQGGRGDFFASRVRRLHHRMGFNVALPIQPGHGFRKASWPRYPDLEPLANVAGMMRVVSEIRALVRWLRPQATAVAVSGVSLGSPVAALVSELDDVDAVAVYTPILGLNEMIGHHEGRWGTSVDRPGSVMLTESALELASVINPLTVEPTPPPQRRLIVGAWHDQMAPRAQAVALHERWGGQLYWYDGSHVGHVFSRRIQAVTERFLSPLTTADSR